MTSCIRSPNRDPVLWSQKVFPEIQNRALLQRGFSANKIGGWGSRTEGSPTGKSSSEFDVFAPAPAPHARTHARQINGARNRMVARPFWGFCPSSPAPSALPSVFRSPSKNRVHGHQMLTFCFIRLEYMASTWIPMLESLYKNNGFLNFT